MGASPGPAGRGVPATAPATPSGDGGGSRPGAAGQPGPPPFVSPLRERGALTLCCPQPPGFPGRPLGPREVRIGVAGGSFQVPGVASRAPRPRPPRLGEVHALGRGKFQVVSLPSRRRGAEPPPPRGCGMIEVPPGRQEVAKWLVEALALEPRRRLRGLQA